MSSIERSDAFARQVVDVCVEFAPEEMTFAGFTEADPRASEFSEAFEDRALAAYRSVRTRLQGARDAEADAAVGRDLDILIRYLTDRIETIEVQRKLELPYLDLAGAVFVALQLLLDPATAAARRPAARLRLRQYTGLASGSSPAAEVVRERIRAGLDGGLLAPPRMRVERDLAVAGAYLPGLRDAFAACGIDAAPELDALAAQLADYESFVRAEVLPRARDDFRVPREKYALLLRTFGIDQDPEALAHEARAAFAELQAQAERLAAQIAGDRGLASSSYREVLRLLAAEQLPEDRVLESYVERNAQIEAIVTRESIVTLPARELSIRYATEAESASIPSPYFQPAPIVGNQGERGTFVLPRSIPGADGEALKMLDDTSVGMSWPLCAHEARPGHELQFSSLVTGAVSLARKLFAFNSVNVEGWGLYSERLIEPFMPPEGKLYVLTMRMLRTARAFLDPELQLGMISPEAATETLERDVAISPAFALSEVQRYTFLAPGQAPSYYYGYVRLVALRADVERELGDAFDAKSFHDFILAQGMVSPALLRDAVMGEYVPKRRQVPA